MILVTAPAICAIVEKSDRPEACSVFSNTEKNIMPKLRVQHILMYSSAILTISGLLLWECTYIPVPNTPNSRNTTYITAERNIVLPTARLAICLSP